MEITYLGHSCFFINANGFNILTDPYPSSLGFNPPNENIDIITTSHSHFDHNNTDQFKNCEILSSSGLFNFDDISIKGIPSYHDKKNGLIRGNNIIYIFDLKGYRLCHLGDLGHLLSDTDIDMIGNLDVLFVPVGGNLTIDGIEASDICKKLYPKIIIPMHYKTSRISLPIDGLETFLLNIKNGEYINKSTLSLNESIPDRLNVKILTPKI